MESKEIIEKFISSWNEMSAIIDNNKHKLELIERDYPNIQVKGMRVLDVIIKQTDKNEALFKQTWNYELMSEDTVNLLYTDLLQNILSRGISESIRDWESGRIERVDPHQIKFNPTADDVLHKAGYKLVKI